MNSFVYLVYVATVTQVQRKQIPSLRIVHWFIRSVFEFCFFLS